MKKILLSTLLISSFLTLSSCGDKKGERTGLPKVEESVKDENKGLVVTLEGIFPVNDTYQLFYSISDQFDEEKSLKIPVYGQPVLQKIVFEIPNEEKPQNLRLDFGSNDEQQYVSVKNISIEYMDRVILNGENGKFLEFFPENSTVVYLPQKLKLELKKNAEGIFDPILFSNENLKKILNKTYNETK
ncbi:hypothetical protein OBK20_04385 [Empedobacter falsenii]